MVHKTNQLRLPIRPKSLAHPIHPSLANHVGRRVETDPHQS